MVAGAITLLVAAIVARAIQIAAAWDRAVVLRLGKFRGLRGPGIFGIIPVVDAVAFWIDVRVITSTFKAQQTLTRDTVPVDVDAVLFWKVVDERAALAVADYRDAISWAAQTALRDIIGKTMLADLLEGRDKIGGALRVMIDAHRPWGVNVISVEVRRRPPSRRATRERDVDAGPGRAPRAARPASSSATRSGRSPRSSARPPRPTRTTPSRCTCAR